MNKIIFQTDQRKKKRAQPSYPLRGGVDATTEQATWKVTKQKYSLGAVHVKNPAKHGWQVSLVHNDDSSNGRLTFGSGRYNLAYLVCPAALTLAIEESCVCCCFSTKRSDSSWIITIGTFDYVCPSTIRFDLRLQTIYRINVPPRSTYIESLRMLIRRIVSYFGQRVCGVKRITHIFHLRYLHFSLH